MAVVGGKNSVPQWGAESSRAGQWLPQAGTGHGRSGRAPGRCGCAVTLCLPGAQSGLPCPVPACCCRGSLARAGSGSHSGVELWRSRTRKGSSGGRKKGVV